MHLSTDLAAAPVPSTPAPRTLPTLILTARGDCAPNGSGLTTRDRHIVVAMDCTCATPPPPLDRLSLRSIRRGAERLSLSRRRVLIDEESYALIDGRPDRGSQYVGDDVVSPLCVIFRAGSFDEAMAAPDGEGVTTVDAHRAEWLESLQPLKGDVLRHLQQIGHHARAGWADPLWWDEQILLLLSAAIDAEKSLQARESSITALKPATRRELLRRVLLASDFIQSTYDQPSDLGDIASAARLSRFHLVRLFRDVHGVTPHAFLLRKRLQVALRLLAQTRLGLDDIAARAGLGTRSSLFRHVRRMQGRSASALRASWPPQGA